jgi:hypothetical protein
MTQRSSIRRRRAATRLAPALVLVSVVAATSPITAELDQSDSKHLRALALATHTGNLNPGVLPPHAKALGKSYGEWGDIWWNWAVQFPMATNPQLDQTGEDCARGQSGHIWFLAGVFGGGSATRDCTVPPGRFLFFPIVNTFLAVEGTEDEERAAVNEMMDNVSVLECTVDGVPLQDLFRYRVESPPGGFVLTVPPGSLFTELGAPAGDYAPAVSDGYWLMLSPLPVGRHEIKFHAAGVSTLQEVTYHLNVAPSRRAGTQRLGNAWRRTRRAQGPAYSPGGPFREMTELRSI